MRGIKQIEAERIVNLSEFERLVADARIYATALKRSLSVKDIQTSINIVEKIDLELHKMEAFEFLIERRNITINNSCEHQ